MPTSRPNQQVLSTALSSLYRAFDAVATWVTQLSWWKFLLFAALLLTAGTIVQQELFSGGEEDIVRTERGARRDEPTITIDDSGIHLNPRGHGRSGATVNIYPEAEAAKAEAAAAAASTEAEKAAGKAGKAAADAAAAGVQAEAAGKATQVAPVPPVPPMPPGTPARVAKSGRGGDEVHIDLPPQISDELSDAIEAAVDDAAEAKARSYHKQASTWFTSFVWLLVLALFGTKALVGGKKRAEA